LKALGIRDLAFILILAYCVAWGIRGITFAKAVPQVKPLTIGEHFLLEGARFSDTRDLVLITTEKCPYSRASQQFHRRLMDAAHRLQVPLLVVTDKRSSAPQDVIASLDKHDQVLKTNLTSLRIAGTPTVLLMERGKVTGSWVGRLNKSQEESLLARLDGSFDTLTLVGDPPQVLQLKPQELSVRLRQSRILDIRSRDEFRTSHLDGATNIPADELGARMQIELHDDARPFVIDCRAMDMDACSANAKLLQWGGLKQLWLLDAGAMGSACSMSPL
jgi:hypothetical protein